MPNEVRLSQSIDAVPSRQVAHGQAEPLLWSDAFPAVGVSVLDQGTDTVQQLLVNRGRHSGRLSERCVAPQLKNKFLLYFNPFSFIFIHI